MALAMASTMAVSLTACGGGKAAETTAAPAAAETTAAATEAAKEAETTAAAAEESVAAGGNIGVCIYKFDDAFMTTYRNALQEILEGKGYTVTFMDGKNDQAEQNNQINNFIAQGVDALIINPVMTSAADQIIATVKDADIPTVLINREPTAEQMSAYEKLVYVGCDARQSGTMQGELILETETKGDINGDGKISYIMIQGDPENVDAQYRTEFSVKALEDAGMKPEDIDYINVHGTSTGLGDISEPTAILKAFGEHAYKLNISSTKSMTGHLLGAAGAVEAIACTLAVKNDIVPPTINFHTLAPELDPKLNFTFNEPQKREVKVAISNTFGFGGHNACVVIKK